MSTCRVSEPRPTVFVLDDADARHLCKLIEPIGLSAETFRSPWAFLEAYDACRPGCVLLDLYVPVRTGRDVQQDLLARGAVIPVVVLTGRPSVPPIVDAFKKGAVDCLEKPVDPALLHRAVHRALQIDAVRRRNEAERSRVGQRLRLLTTRERQVFWGVVEGLANKQIALRLGIATKTVEVHRARVMAKTEAANVPALVRMALRTWQDSLPPCRETPYPCSTAVSRC